MSYALDFNIALGPSQTGLTLTAQLINTTGATVGGAIATGFTEIGNGNYLWHYTGFTDGFHGGVEFFNGATLVAFVAVNPQDAGVGQNAPYTLSINLALGLSQTGLTLSAQLINSDGSNQGSAITSGFVEVGGGNYLWTYSGFSGTFTGGVTFSAGSTVKAFVALDPSVITGVPTSGVGAGSGSGGSGARRHEIVEKRAVLLKRWEKVQQDMPEPAKKPEVTAEIEDHLDEPKVPRIYQENGQWFIR